jgi:hypothetical protein
MAGLTVRYTLAGTAVNGNDYAALSGSLTIPAGAASAAVTVTPIDDTEVEGNETVILAVSADAAYIVGAANSATVTIASNDQAPPTVTVAATDANASETGPDSGAFSISRTGDTTAGLTVHYTLAGTAMNGTDYGSLSGSLTIPAGSASATVTVTPIDDTTVEGNETVILTVSADAAYTVGSPNSATVTIAENEQGPPLGPVVAVAASDANASETGPDGGTFTISRTGDTTTGVTVLYTLAGTALNGSDYASLSGSVTIPAGAASATVTVTPIDDTAVEGNETVILTVSADAAYTVGSPSSATVTIADNEPPPPQPTVTVAATDAKASEKGTKPGTFTISRVGGMGPALAVKYSLDGTAVNGIDYELLSGSVIIPAGASSATVIVQPIDDIVLESDETVILSVSSDADYTVGLPNSATVTIDDKDKLRDRPPPGPVVTVAATDADASETGPDTGTFTITRTSSTASALTVYYSLGGKAVNGTDYALLSGSVIIPAGAASATVTVTPIYDTDKEGKDTVILTLSFDTAYTVGSPERATVKIAHSDELSVEMKAEAKASESGPNPGMFTISRKGGKESAWTVSYSLGGTAVNGIDYELLSGSVTIPAGASSATVIVQPIDDTEVEGDETVVLILSADAAYKVGPHDRATVTIADNDLLLLGTDPPLTDESEE